MNKLKIIIILLASIIIFIALTTQYIMKNIVIPFEDAIFLTFFVTTVLLTLKLICNSQHRKLEEKSLMQHTFMQTIFDSVPFVMYLKTIEGKILYTNRSHAKMLGSKIENIVGTNISEYYSNLDNISDEDTKMIESHSAISIIREIESKNGTKGWYDINKVPIYDKYGEVTHIVVMFRDITTVKQMEKRKETFVATLTHDLKTPTIAQIKSLDMLLKGYFGHLSSEQLDIINQTRQSCEYMYNLIFTILDTYKYDNGQLKINYEQFNLRELIDDVVFELSTLCIDNSQTVNILSTCDDEIISADRFQLKRVIINLLSNAINYGKNGTVIEIILSKTSFDVNIEVKSASKYLREDVIEEIFEKYKSIENSKTCKIGTGLGLYLSKQIIKAHNGDIFAKSEQNGVCNFGFSIPKCDVLVCK